MSNEGVGLNHTVRLQASCWNSGRSLPTARLCSPCKLNPQPLNMNACHVLNVHNSSVQGAAHDIHELHGDAGAGIAQLDARQVRVLHVDAVLMLEVGHNIHPATHLFTIELITVGRFVCQPVDNLARNLHLPFTRDKRISSCLQGGSRLAIFCHDLPETPKLTSHNEHHSRWTKELCFSVVSTRFLRTCLGEPFTNA